LNVGVILSLMSYIAYTIYTGVQMRRDPEFQACLHKSGVYYGISVFLAWISMSTAICAGLLARKAPLITWVITFLSVSAFVGFQYYHIREITRTFQGGSGPMSGELLFGFGQLMVFFMIFQLLVEFCVALYGKTHWLNPDLSINLMLTGILVDFSKLTNELEILGGERARLGPFMVQFAKVVLLAFPSKALAEMSGHTAREPRLYSECM